MEELKRRIEAGVPGGWSRRRDSEDRLKKTRVWREGIYCFSKAIEPTRV